MPHAPRRSHPATSTARTCSAGSAHCSAPHSSASGMAAIYPPQLDAPPRLAYGARMSFVGVLLYVLVLFLIAGFTAWLINLFVPAEGPYKRAALGILGL